MGIEKVIVDRWHMHVLLALRSPSLQNGVLCFEYESSANTVGNISGMLDMQPS